MDIKDLDLNLLRVFDAIYRAGSVSRAAETLGISQPAASQGLTRLRLLVKDQLFTRVPGGVTATPKAQRLEHAVQAALATLTTAFNEDRAFDASTAQWTVRLHLSDIGEARFLPALMLALHAQAPGVRVHSTAVPLADIPLALDSGRLDFAIGFLPSVTGTQQVTLVDDSYIVLLRAGHPLVSGDGTRPLSIKELRQLEYVVVRSHVNTIRILQLLKLDGRVRLTAAHFLALPSIVKTTDLGVIMPRRIAQDFALQGGYALSESALPLQDFSVSLHWSRRYENDPAHQWIRSLLVQLIQAHG